MTSIKLLLSTILFASLNFLNIDLKERERESYSNANRMLMTYYDSINPNSLEFIEDKYINFTQSERVACFDFTEHDTQLIFRRKTFYEDSSKNQSFAFFVNKEKIKDDDIMFINGYKEYLYKFFEGFDYNYQYQSYKYGKFGDYEIFSSFWSSPGCALKEHRLFLLIKYNDQYKVYFSYLDFESGPYTYGDYNNDGKFDIVTAAINHVSYPTYWGGTTYLINYDNIWNNEYSIDSLDHFSCSKSGFDFKIY